MKRFFLISLFLCCVTVVLAQTVYTPGNLPNVHVQDKTKYVCNPEGILSTQACYQIDRMLYDLEQKTGIETVVAVIPSIGEKSCFDFAHELLNLWGVGKKEKNNGLVVLLVTDQRCIQFYTGYGLEGDLPDAICKRIQTQKMIPYLKDNHWDQGMVAGIKAVYSRLYNSMKNDTPADNESGDVLIGVGLFSGFIILAGMVFFLAVRTASKCPHCGKHELQRSNSRIIAKRNGMKIEEVTYICRNCGHIVTRRQQSYDEHYRSGGRGPFIGGFGGGSFSGGAFTGGGFGGGSFGGGMGGGGGAGSKF